MEREHSVFEKEYSVLFVDDEKDILRALKRGLFDEDYNCFFAESGMRALTIMDTHDIHVIVTDMRMPVMDGLRLLKEVDKKHPEIVKIILSGYMQLQQILTTINQVDIFKFITKPWDLENEFKGVIKKAIEYYKLHEENANMKKDLQLKNQAYLNILKSIDDKVTIANMETDIVRSFSKEMLNFNCNLLRKLNSNYLYLFESQNKVYEILSSNMQCTKNTLKPEDFINSLLSHISSVENIKILNYSNKIKYNHEIQICDQIAKSIIRCAIASFKDDMDLPGVYVAACNEGEQKLLVSIFFSYACMAAKRGLKDCLVQLNLKRTFLNYALAGSAAVSNMNFQSLQRENYIVFQLEIPCQNQHEDHIHSSRNQGGTP